jgi:Tol biopolymer transport system component
MTSAFFSSRQPVFSQDGKTLYFLSSRHEQKSQLWSLNLETGGEAQQITQLVVYPGEHHGGWSFANEKDAKLRELNWFGHYLVSNKQK